MTVSDEEDEFLANFLESEVLSDYDVSDHEETKKMKEVEEEEESKSKKPRVDIRDANKMLSQSSSSSLLYKSRISSIMNINNSIPRRIETGEFSKIPSELFHHILKFLSSEDLVACTLVCRFLNYVASDEYLWRRLYCMRWGLLPPTKLRECSWKKLYIQRDEEDMVEFVRNCPPEFKEYYIQMQAAKRSQAPLYSQVTDDRIILDKTVADQVSTYKSSKGLSDKVVVNHVCSGETCSYYHVGDVFVCEKTGHVHVCDDTCKEVVLDPDNGIFVCTISGHCFDRLVSSAEIGSDNEQQQSEEQQQGGATDEAEPFMGSGRFARAYVLGYNCADEKELEATLRFC